jgi:HEAT repeat protein
LTLLGDRAFLDTIVLSLPSRTLGTRSRSYLQEMGPAILPELYPYLNDPEAEIRATLCDIIASFGDPDAIPRLTPLINDPSQTVADKANRAVERLRRSSAAKASR